MRLKILFGAMALCLSTSFLALQTQAQVRPAGATGCYRSIDGGFQWSPSFCRSQDLCDRNMGPGHWNGSSCSSAQVSNSQGSANSSGSQQAGGIDCEMGDGSVGNWTCTTPDNCSCVAHAGTAAKEPASGTDKSASTDHPVGGECTTGGTSRSSAAGHYDANGVCQAGEGTNSTDGGTTTADGTATNDGNTATSDNLNCDNQVEQNACDAAKNKAVGTCDLSADTGMNSAIKGANEATQVIQQAQSVNLIQACSQIGTVSTAANAAVFAFQANCGRAQNDCLSACNTAKAKAESCKTTDAEKRAAGAAAVTAMNMCNKQNTQLQSAQQSLVGLIQTGNQSVQCAAAAGNDYCSKFPNNPGCQAQLAQNCSNPQYALVNTACACVGAPQSEACLGAQKAAGAIGVGNDLAGGGAGLTGQSTGGVPMPSQDQYEKPNIPAGQKQAGGESGGNGGGGGGPGKLSSLNQADKNGKGPAGERQSLLQGFMGSGNGGGGWGGFVSAAKSAAQNFFGGNSAQNAKLQAERDLLKTFLPKQGQGIIIPGSSSKYNNGGGRQIAGMDSGISGPNSDLWLNVKNRYRQKADSLLP